MTPPNVICMRTTTTADTMVDPYVQLFIRYTSNNNSNNATIAAHLFVKMMYPSPPTTLLETFASGVMASCGNNAQLQNWAKAGLDHSFDSALDHNSEYQEGPIDHHCAKGDNKHDDECVSQKSRCCFVSDGVSAQAEMNDDDHDDRTTDHNDSTQQMDFGGQRSPLSGSENDEEEGEVYLLGQGPLFNGSNNCRHDHHHRQSPLKKKAVEILTHSVGGRLLRSIAPAKRVHHPPSSQRRGSRKADAVVNHPPISTSSPPRRQYASIS